MNTRAPTLLTVLSGRFDSQPGAFATLLDLAFRAEIKVDLADVDVIQSAAEVRLAHYFRPAIVARIEAARGEDNTVLVLRPSALTMAPGLLPREGALRLLGRFAGEVIETDGVDDSWL